MSEQLKYIVDELNKEPFKRNYNLISFDSLQSLQLLQVLNDVFAEINPQHKIDLRDEDPEQMAKRMFTFLRILKFKPQTNAGSLNAFRNGLIQGDKLVIYPILQWLFENLPELKKRAYLARYLVKVEIPPDQLADQELYELHESYVEMMEQFKEQHKTVEQLRTSGFSTGEIKKDISNMEDEKEQLPQTLNIDQVTTVTTQFVHSDQRYQRMQQQLKDMRMQGVGTTGADLIKKLDEENKVNMYLCQEKLPKIKLLSTEINSLIEKRMVRNDPIDDKLSLFRQQASIIGRKKEAVAEKLQEAMDELSNAESEFQKKKELLKDSEGSEVLKGDEFKRYVNKLRGKSTVYKKKRQELAEVRAEYGVLARTEEILRGKDETYQEQLASLEAKKGVSGYHDTQEELEKVSAIKSELDEQKGKTLEDISELVRTLNATIADKKSALAPVIKELRPMRQKCQVRIFRYRQVIEVQQKRIDDELKSYRAADTADRKKSFRLAKQVVELHLSPECMLYFGKRHKADLTKLLECKRRCMSKKQQEFTSGATQQGQDGENVLVL
ncbi:PREDICTED: intraflagellar transport protein 81 homolog [Acropora digitifera]|uniref:intraflagellar transport protein 81 homolog n=1 Tax=Acropora digitifera TaxID=70779 RepID=UPI00077AD12A|nr:PREDICTED: intraflagellar transport protein 81 homolog [Acropora digitifera]